VVAFDFNALKSGGTTRISSRKSSIEAYVVTNVVVDAFDVPRPSEYSLEHVPRNAWRSKRHVCLNVDEKPPGAVVTCVSDVGTFLQAGSPGPPFGGAWGKAGSNAAVTSTAEARVMLGFYAGDPVVVQEAGPASVFSRWSSLG
jgi:hypothetical protein